MNNCIPCPPCQTDIPLICEPYGTVTTGNRVVVEDDAFCTKTLASSDSASLLINDSGVKWLTAPNENATLVYNNGIKWSVYGSWKLVTSTYFASFGEKLSVNSVIGGFNIYLPQNPSQFDEITFADHYNTWGVNNVIINRNASLIEGVADNLILNTTWPNQIMMRFEGSTWRVYSIL
jgi:hypothetical protein